MRLDRHFDKKSFLRRAKRNDTEKMCFIGTAVNALLKKNYSYGILLSEGGRHISRAA